MLQVLTPLVIVYVSVGLLVALLMKRWVLLCGSGSLPAGAGGRPEAADAGADSSDGPQSLCRPAGHISDGEVGSSCRYRGSLSAGAQVVDTVAAVARSGEGAAGGTVSGALMSDGQACNSENSECFLNSRIHSHKSAQSSSLHARARIPALLSAVLPVPRAPAGGLRAAADAAACGSCSVGPGRFARSFAAVAADACANATHVRDYPLSGGSKVVLFQTWGFRAARR